MKDPLVRLVTQASVSVRRPEAAGAGAALEILVPLALPIRFEGALRYLKMREYQAQQRLIVKHIDGNKNPADLFTKPLPRPAFQEYCRAIGLVSGTKELVNENFY